MAWEDVLYSFAGKIKNPGGGETPVLIFILRDQQGFFYIDGSKISPSYFVFEDSHGEDKFERSYLTPKAVDLTEKKFKWVASEISARLKTAYIDKPVFECIKGSTFFLPTFNQLKDAANYGNEIISAADSDGVKGRGESPVLEHEDEESRKISAPSTTREEWEEGMVIEGKYTIQEVFKGGMGIVYIVFDPGNARFYALKTFQEKYLWNERVIKQFVKEAEIWINLDKHPHIVKAELVKFIEGKPYIFLEYIPGTDLEVLLKEGVLPAKKSVALAIQFCEGMSYAFKKLGLIHRDIKPSNCIITKEEVLKITDFGLGKIFDETPAEGELTEIPQKHRKKKSDSGSSSTAMVGTLPFMAPELFTDLKAAGMKTDIYSFGVLLYMMLTGINPFYHEDTSELIRMHMLTEPALPHELNPDVPVEISGITMKCLKKRPRDRFENFEEIGKELERIYEESFGSRYELPQTGDEFSEDDWINKGISLASIDRHRDAIITFEQALKINPDSTGAKNQKGKSLLKSGHVDEALYNLNEVIRADPSNWEAWFYKGEAERVQLNNEGALFSFERALELQPSRVEIIGSMGALLEEMGKVDDALFFFDYALERNPKSEELWENKGKILLKQYRFEEASDCFDKVIEINPRHQSAWSHRGEALYRLGFYAEAVNAYRTAITLKPRLIKERLRMGSCYIELGDMGKATLTYDRALKIDHADPEIYIAKAILLEDMDFLDEASKCLKNAMDSNPLDKKILLHAARLYLKTGEFEKALETCNTVSDAGEDAWELSLLKESASYWIDRKRNTLSKFTQFRPVENQVIYKDLHSLLSVFCSMEDALNHLQSELEIKEDGHKYFYSASLYKIMGDMTKAQEYAEKAIDLKEARSLLQEIYRESESMMELQKSKKGILAGLRKKETKSERDPEESMLLGLERMHHGEFREAMTYFQESLEKNPDLFPCWFFGGVALSNIGAGETARKFLNTFKEKFPDSPGLCKYEIQIASDRRVKEELFLKWISLLPCDPEPWISYLKFLTDGDEIESARIIAKEIIKRHVNRWNVSKRTARFWNLRGILELFMGDTGKSSRFFERSLKYEAENPVALLGIARLSELKGDTARAFEIYAQPALKNASPIMGIYLSASLNLKTGKAREAMSLIERALEIKPDSPVLCYKKARLYADSNEYASFWNYYYSIYDLDAKFSPFYSLRTRAFVDTEQVHEAFTYIKGAFDKDPANVLLLNILGFLNLKMNMPQEAIENFNRIMALDSQHTKCYLGKGIAYYMMGQYRDAIIFFEKYLTFFPNDPGIYLFIGATRFHLQDHKEALLYFRKIFEMKNRFPRAWSNLGIYYCKREKYMHALRYAEWALRTDKDNFYAWICKSKAQQELGNQEEAYKSVEKALFYSPHDLYGWVQRGITEFRMKNFKKSLESFSKACEIDDKQAKVWYNRGAAALCARDYQEAQQYLDRALKINPALYLAWLAKAVLAKLVDDHDVYVRAKSYARALNPEAFDEWYEQFSASKGSQFQDSIAVYEEIILSFDLPRYPALEGVEPIQVLHYLDLDRNF